MSAVAEITLRSDKMFTFILENPLFLEVLEFGIALLAEVIIFCFTLYFERKKATSETVTPNKTILFFNFGVTLVANIIRLGVYIILQSTANPS